jgi:4-amino-4-deoxy-L-arabinose transferase-like glycosyltransferase
MKAALRSTPSSDEPAGCPRRVRHAALAAILIASFLLKLDHLNHAALRPLDEVFHAIVARNLLKHPLTQTLVDQPFLPYDYRDWQANNVWLHKPPMALWQIAVSYLVFGVNTFALRLPSAILSTLAAWLTYLIGAELLDATAGLIAAGFQAFNPVILMVVHGYVFSDHVDIALLFWTEASIWLLARGLRTGKRLDWATCGIAEGLAFLSKTYPALIVLGLALLAWLFRPIKRRKKVRELAIFLIAAAATALPWNLYAAIRFPREFAFENLNILHHLNENIEQWAGPWDRIVFDYWISEFHAFYPAMLAGAIIATVRAVQTRRIGLWLILAWATGVAIPNLLATSKTPTATLIGWPPMWLLLGFLVSSALKADRWALGTWFVSIMLAILLLNNQSIPGIGWGYDSGGAGALMRQHLWVIVHLAAALGVGAVVGRLPLRRTMIILPILAAIPLLLDWRKTENPRGYLALAWRVTEINQNRPDFSAFGAFAAKLPANAAFVVDEQSKFENKLMEFAADRSCYALENQNWRALAGALIQAGALPYLASPVDQRLPMVFDDAEAGMKVYACTPAAARAAGIQ